MKETGIIMSGNHPKLILDGIKTQTRRVINPQPVQDGNIYGWHLKRKGKTLACWAVSEETLKRGVIKFCPYGQVGDRLWVRETWRVESFMDGEPILFSYKDGSTMEDRSGEFDPPDYEDWYERICIQSTEDAEKAFEQGLVKQNEEGYYNWGIGKSPCRWRPSLFMPRWASRITREITEVRVERLQEITEEDALAEGVEPFKYSFTKLDKLPVQKFRDLWDSLNAKRGYPWESNPWVWPISFKVVPKWQAVKIL